MATTDISILLSPATTQVPKRKGGFVARTTRCSFQQIPVFLRVNNPALPPGETSMQAHVCTVFYVDGEMLEVSDPRKT